MLQAAQQNDIYIPTLCNHPQLRSVGACRLCVVEIKGSHKIGKYMPGTLIPVLEESRLFADQPEYALLLSWHIAEELIPKLRDKGFAGKFIIPLPRPRVVE